MPPPGTLKNKQKRHLITTVQGPFDQITDVTPGLHETASRSIQNWRAVARVAAGDKEEADDLVADFLEQLIDIARYSPKKPDALEVQTMFLTYVRIRSFNRFSYTANTARLPPGVRTYDQFEAAAKTYLAAYPQIPKAPL